MLLKTCTSKVFYATVYLAVIYGYYAIMPGRNITIVSVESNNSGLSVALDCFNVYENLVMREGGNLFLSSIVLYTRTITPQAYS